MDALRIESVFQSSHLEFKVRLPSNKSFWLREALLIDLAQIRINCFTRKQQHVDVRMSCGTSVGRGLQQSRLHGAPSVLQKFPAPRRTASGAHPSTHLRELPGNVCLNHLKKCNETFALNRSRMRRLVSSQVVTQDSKRQVTLAQYAGMVSRGRRLRLMVGTVSLTTTR